MGAATGATARRPWGAINNWVYWLDGPRLDQIASTSFELAVIDYSADGSAAGAFSAARIDALRHATCDRRVLAYLSIGEAENYRWYWQRGWRPDAPAWIVQEDADWQGNFWVQYWQPAWQQIIFRYLDTIIAAGFDGVYLDRVDAYAESYARAHRQSMVTFVRDIAHYARAHSPLGQDFGIFAQNAEELAAQDSAYAESLTGIGREEIYIRATNLPTPVTERSGVEADLRRFRQHNRYGLVLSVDYADSEPLVRQAYEQSRRNGFVPYVAGVGLDRIQLNPGYLPECRQTRTIPANTTKGSA